MMAAYGIFTAHCGYKWLNPTEYKSEEEREQASIRFSLTDMCMRYLGYIRGLREKHTNKIELNEIRMPEQSGR